MSVQPLRVSFRRQVREQSLEVAHQLLLEHGWDAVRMADVAEQTGVSRPTLYSEFGSKQGLAEALVIREAERFLAGIEAELGNHPSDAERAVTAAALYTLEEAARNPLLHAVLTSTRGGEDSLLPLLTTRSAPVRDVANDTLTRWFRERFPYLPPTDIADTVDAVVRLTVSHLVQPGGSPQEIAARLGRVAARQLEIPSSAAHGSARKN